MDRLLAGPVLVFRDIRQGAEMLFRIWFAFGWPAFAGLITIFALMMWKPAL